MESPSSRTDLAEIWSSCRRSLRITSKQCPMFFSLVSDDAPLGTDALVHPWPNVQALAGRDNSTPLRPTMAFPSMQGFTVPGARRYIPPSSGPDSAMGLARERLNLDAAGLHPNVVATILSARAISTLLKEILMPTLGSRVRDASAHLVKTLESTETALNVSVS